jgi:hypothetical protein
MGILYDGGEEESWHGPTTAADMAMAKEVADALCRHYPGHPWLVNVDSAKGVALIRNPLLNDNYAMVRHTKNLTLTNASAWAMQAGGEWLERYNLPRRGAEHDQYASEARKLW